MKARISVDLSFRNLWPVPDDPKPLYEKSILVSLHGMPIASFRCRRPEDFEYIIGQTKEDLPQGSLMAQVCRHGDMFELWGKIPE